MRKTCAFLCFSGLVSLAAWWGVEKWERGVAVGRRDVGLGRREVRIEPMEAMVISPGPMTSATRIPKIQNPCQSAIKSRTPHRPAPGQVAPSIWCRWSGLEASSTSSPSRIEAYVSSRAGRAASGPPIRRGLCSDKWRNWSIGKLGPVPSSWAVVWMSCSSSGGVVGCMIRIKSAPKRLTLGDKSPRKNKNLTGSRSPVEGEMKIRREEKEERAREERPMSESGTERDSVGWVGKESDAFEGFLSFMCGWELDRGRTARETGKVGANGGRADQEVCGCKPYVQKRGLRGRFGEYGGE